ncbi:hypothetical protein GMORB2_1586 [Geosmithia morbida]|uniref:Uncharacterized protein n=1 Tax=Geosmithia morbida TaxID=1094350 RepID=A0A9P4YTX7_9HYPO|nr:uncharacterized protein GMORB2_1586 [Geosmithia morbida]KAF4121747.1 hypothetical protein GMORB2_1586 [Geosmithia morbida]
MHLSGRAPDSSNDNKGGGNSSGTAIKACIIVLIVLGIAGVVVASFYISRAQRGGLSLGRKKSRGGQGGGLWSRLIAPLTGSRRRQYEHASSGDDNAELEGTHRDVEQTPNRNTATVDRNTSVRSVLTLPAYSQKASNTEQVIAREGDRDGMDVVIDLPTEEEQEARREEEMAALYQLRSTRRQQQQERADIRRQREQARQQGDMQALVEAQARAQALSTGHNAVVEELRRDIDRAKENNRGHVSSVSYADLGVARHDGTRIRAGSQESERTGLLSDAADMGHRSRSRADSVLSHSRDASAGSAVSLVSGMPSPDLSNHARAVSLDVPLAGSSPELVGSDLGVEAIPPPEYEDVPLDDGSAARGSAAHTDEPPIYSGPYRSASIRSRRSQHGTGSDEDVVVNDAADGDRPRGRGVGSVPQLPSLRISHLPSIVVEPSSAHPMDDPRDNGDDRRPTTTNV